MKRVQRVAVCQMSYVVCRMPYIEELYSAIVPNSAMLLRITEQASVISIFREKKGSEQRYSGAVFRYFVIDTGIRVYNIRQFRYLIDLRSRKPPAEAAGLRSL
jgi:hypothetical protein